MLAVADDGYEFDHLRRGANVILCADDFGMTAGVSRGIAELAHAGRLSATSAIVTLPRWRDDAAMLRDLRGFVAIGLHLNLTMGEPLTQMTSLAPDGEFPDHVRLVRNSLAHTLNLDEIGLEIDEQITRFLDAVGFEPDFIDGHQHVHALPGIRTAFADVVARRFPGGRILVRDPADRWAAIVKRKQFVAKALALSALAQGFGRRIRAFGFPTNHGFAGLSSFDMTSNYLEELDCSFAMRGPRHLVMCHPGYVDEGLGDLDSVVERRRQELDALFAAPGLDSAIWRVKRRAQGPVVEWREALPV